MQPKEIEDNIKSSRVSTIREAARIGLEKCREYLKAKAITNSYSKDFQRKMGSGKTYNYRDNSRNKNTEYRSSSRSKYRSNSTESASSYNRDRSRSRSREPGTTYQRTSTDRWEDSNRRIKDDFNNSEVKERGGSNMRNLTRPREKSNDRHQSREKSSDRHQSREESNKSRSHSHSGSRYSKYTDTRACSENICNITNNDDVRRLNNKDIDHSIDIDRQLNNSLEDRSSARVTTDARDIVISSCKDARDIVIDSCKDLLNSLDNRVANLINRDKDEKLDRRRIDIETNKADSTNEELDKKLVKICNIDNSRKSSLPKYLVNIMLRMKGNNKRLFPVHAKLDSLADVNWISKRLYLELNSKYKIRTSDCDVICKLVDKSEIRINQCCDLDILIKMKDKAKLSINCRFIIIDSDQDLVLGWNAIKSFNLMQVNVADEPDIKNRSELSNKKVQFNHDIDLVNLIYDTKINPTIDTSLGCKSELKSSIKYSKQEYISISDIKTFNKLCRFNTILNGRSRYKTKTIRKGRCEIRTKWRELALVNTLNLDSSNINVYDENTTFCNLDKNANLEVDKVSDRHGELAGDGSNRKDNIDIEFNSDLGDKLGAIPIDKNRNCNLPSDSITERFAERIIDNPLGRDILSDDDMIREERSSFNLDVGKPSCDLDIVLGNIDSELSTEQYKRHSDLLRKMSAVFSDVLPEQPAKVPPFQIKVKKGRKILNQKTRRISAESLRSFCKEEINKLINSKVIIHSSSPVGSPVILAKKPSLDPSKKNYRLYLTLKMSMRIWNREVAVFQT